MQYGIGAEVFQAGFARIACGHSLGRAQQTLELFGTQVDGKMQQGRAVPETLQIHCMFETESSFGCCRLRNVSLLLFFPQLQLCDPHARDRDLG